MRSKHLYIIICCLTILLPGCKDSKKADDWHTVQGSAWGTFYHVKWEGPADLADSVTRVIERVDASLSLFRESALTARLNRGDTTVRADALLRNVISQSRHLSSITGRHFDPTVGALVEAWGFGRRAADTEWSAPTDVHVDSLLADTGMARVMVDDNGRVTLPGPSTCLDFSAVAKGYGCDLIADALMAGGARACMVEAGGEVAARGLNQRGLPWRIMVESPAGDGSGATMLDVTDRGVATSGNYRQHRDTLGHTLNPITGRPARQRILSATVVAPTCLTADAMATACMAMDPDDALALARPDSIRVILILPDGSLKDSD